MDLEKIREAAERVARSQGLEVFDLEWKIGKQRPHILQDHALHLAGHVEHSALAPGDFRALLGAASSSFASGDLEKAVGNNSQKFVEAGRVIQDFTAGFKSGGLNMSGLPLNAQNQPVLSTAVIR